MNVVAADKSGCGSGFCAVVARAFSRRTRVVPLLGLLAVGNAIAAEAQADPPFIDGSIQFNGGATLNGDLASATAFSMIYGPSGIGSSPEVLGGGTSTGDYAAVPDGTPVVFQTFSFPSSTPIISLWSFTIVATSTTYSFDATSVTVADQNQFFLDIEGTGTAHITGFADTPGVWAVTDTGDGGVPVFTFGADTVATPAPEPSTYVLLLMSLPSVWLACWIRRKARPPKDQKAIQ